MSKNFLLLKSGAVRSALTPSMICGLGLLAGTLSPTVAEAAFYKCIDASGGVTYSSSECPTNEQVAKVIQGSASRAALDCRIARNFTHQVAPMVARGASPDSAFNRYGGINALSPTTIGLINYLYSFKNNRDMSAARMSNLAISRCENGSFGPADCGQFPIGFVDELGGCEGALVLGGTQLHPTSRRLEQREATYANTQQHRSPSAARPIDPRIAQQQRQRDKIELCRTRVRKKIDKVNRKMRNATSASSQDSLRAERHSLGRQLNQCS